MIIPTLLKLVKGFVCVAGRCNKGSTGPLHLNIKLIFSLKHFKYMGKTVCNNLFTSRQSLSTLPLYTELPVTIQEWSWLWLADSAIDVSKLTDDHVAVLRVNLTPCSLFDYRILTLFKNCPIKEFTCIVHLGIKFQTFECPLLLFRMSCNVFYCAALGTFYVMIYAFE